MAYTGESKNPVDEMANSFVEDSNDNQDLDTAHEQKEKAIQQQLVNEQFNQLLAQARASQGGQPTQEPQQADTQQPEQPQDGIATRVLKDVGTGIIQAPLQAVGGMVDAVNNTIDATQDVADWLNKNVVDLGGISWDENGLHWASGKELERAKQPRLPTTAESDSETGKAIRGISQFLTGFATAGKALGAVGEAGKLATVAKGAIADFSVFDPSQNRLSNLIQDAPALKNPVTGFLENKGDDSRMEGRIKNTLEGLGIGVLADGFIKGLRGLKNVRLGKQAAEAGEGAATAKEVTDYNPEIKQQDIESTINGQESPKPEEAINGVNLPTGKDILDANNLYKRKDKIFINWARIDTPNDVKNVIQNMADINAGDLKKATRGKQTFEQTKLNSEALNAWDVLKSRAKGQPLNAEQSLAARQLWATSGDNLTRLAKVATENPSAQNMFALRKMMAVHKEIQNQVIGARTETARALSSWRIPAGATRLNDLTDIIDSMGGDAVNKSIAQKIATLSENGMTKELDDFVNKSVWSRTQEAVAQAWVNGLLTSPHTHVRNFISQTATIGQQMYERKAANLLGQVFGYQSSVPDGEVSQMLSGLVSGMRDSFVMAAKDRAILKNAIKMKATDPEGAKQMLRDSDLGTVWKSAFTGETGFGTGKVEIPRGGALSAETWNQANDSVLGKSLNFLDTYTQLPGKFLGVSDEFFKTSAYRMELQSRAARMASNEVNAGMMPKDQFKDRMADIIENPPDDLVGSLQDFARYITFQDVPENTKIWNLWKSASQIPVLGKIILPFSRTPYNIARYSFERTPLAPLVKRWRDDFNAGGSRREMAMTRMATGSMILLASADLAMSGHITGEGPNNYAQKQALKRQGWQPNSIKLMTDDGNYRYFSYTGLDPISTPLLLASNIVDILSNSEPDDNDPMTERAITATAMAIANQVTSQQYMSGVSSFFAMMNDPQRYGDNWFKRLASSTVPAGVNYIKQTTDPYARETFNMLDAVKARIPGLSETLPVRRDLWGRPVDYSSGLGDLYDFISPMYSSKQNTSPIDKEMNRLELYVPLPQKTMTIKGVSIDLRQYPEAYSRYVQLAGNELTKGEYGIPIDPSTGKGLFDSLNELVSGKSPLSIEYNLRSDGPDGGKATMIRSMVSKYRAAAKQEILKEFPDIKAEYDSKQARRRTNLLGQ